MNININQTLGILVAVLGVLMISTTNLTDLFGAGLAHKTVSVAALLNAIIGAVLAVITGNASMAKSVAALPGVEPLKINAQASPALAALAVDPTQPKIGGTTPQVQEQLKTIAQGA